MKIKVLFLVCIVLLLINILYVSAESECKNINFDGLRIKGDLKDYLIKVNVAPEEDLEVKELKIVNKIDEDLPVIVEVNLYNIDKDQNVETIKLDSVEINARDFKKFNFTLKVPKGIDENERYNLQVKVYENREEPKNCDEKNTMININSKYKSGFFKRLIGWFGNII